MTRRVVAVVGSAVLCCTLAGCSGSRGSAQPGATTTTVPARLTMTGAHVTGVVARYLPGLHRAIAQERTSCGGTDGIGQTDPGAAETCAASLRNIAIGAHDLASALALMRPPDPLTTRVADTSDAARPVAVVYRSYPAGECLPTPDQGTPTRARCETAGREFAMLIAQLDRQLERWRVP